MNDEFFSLDSHLGDAYCGALDDGRFLYAHWLNELRHGIAEENNQ